MERNMKHIIESQQFDLVLIEKIFSIADKLEKKTDNSLKGKIMASLFYEPSTRTRFSFESAILRLGGSVIATENARAFSSVVAGETLEDTVRVISQYVDVIVMRHYEQGAAERAAAVATVPVVNAGGAEGQHPTQALLDLYTIKRELGKINGIEIAFVGDLKNGRTIRSLAYLLGKFKDIKIHFVSPKTLAVGVDILAYLDRHRVIYTENETLEDVVDVVDVLYQTQVRADSFLTKAEYQKHRSCCKIDRRTADQMKKRSVIMHPLPREGEISADVDDSPHVAYFKQAHYGLLLRMALLKYVLSK